MTRPMLALLATCTALLLSAAAHAEDARPCAAAYDRARALTALRLNQGDPLSQLMADLMELRIAAIDASLARLKAMPPRPESKFFQQWSFKTLSQQQSEWDLEAGHREASLDSACVALQARILDFDNLKR